MLASHAGVFSGARFSSLPTNLKTNFQNDRIRQTLLSSIALYPKQVIQGICMMASGCAFQTLNIDIL